MTAFYGSAGSDTNATLEPTRTSHPDLRTPAFKPPLERYVQEIIVWHGVLCVQEDRSGRIL
jgi:hypothetical protein